MSYLTDEMTTLTAGQDRDRSTIDDRYKWNLADLYADLAVWRAAKDAVTSELPRLRTYQGQLGSSAQRLADALEDASRLEKAIGRGTQLILAPKHKLSTRMCASLFQAEGDPKSVTEDGRVVY